MSCAFAMRHGTTRSPVMMRELRLVWAILERHNISLEVTYVASSLNPSDVWSWWRPVDAWQLRPILFSAVTRGKCTLDAFARTLSTQLPRYCSRGPDPRSLARDALLLPWRDEFLWLNPPSGLISRTLSKVEIEGAHGYLVHPHWPSGRGGLRFRPWLSTHAPSRPHASQCSPCTRAQPNLSASPT